MAQDPLQLEYNNQLLKGAANANTASFSQHPWQAIAGLLFDTIAGAGHAYENGMKRGTILPGIANAFQSYRTGQMYNQLENAAQAESANQMSDRKIYGNQIGLPGTYSGQTEIPTWVSDVMKNKAFNTGGQQVATGEAYPNFGIADAAQTEPVLHDWTQQQGKAANYLNSPSGLTDIQSAQKIALATPGGMVAGMLGEKGAPSGGQVSQGTTLQSAQKIALATPGGMVAGMLGEKGAPSGGQVSQGTTLQGGVAKGYSQGQPGVLAFDPKANPYSMTTDYPTNVVDLYKAGLTDREKQQELANTLSHNKVTEAQAAATLEAQLHPPPHSQFYKYAPVAPATPQPNQWSLLDYQHNTMGPDGKPLISNEDYNKALTRSTGDIVAEILAHDYAGGTPGAPSLSPPTKPVTMVQAVKDISQKAKLKIRSPKEAGYSR
jgi:hypothetical protein